MRPDIVLILHQNIFNSFGICTFTRNDIEYVYVWNRTKPIQDLQFDDFRGDTYLNVENICSWIRNWFQTAFPSKNGKHVFNHQYLLVEPGITLHRLTMHILGQNGCNLYNSGKFISTVVDQSELVQAQ